MKKRLGDRMFNFFNISIFLVIGFMTFYPFWNILITSFNDPVDSTRGNLYFWPRMFSTISYSAIFTARTDFFQGAIISLARTAIGTSLTLFCTTLLAFIVSDKKFVLRKFLTRVFILTMYLNAGLIPIFILYRDIGLLNKFPVYILPTLIGAYYLILLKSFIEDIPPSLTEAAEMDGAGLFKVFFSIIIPMAIPVIATVGLYAAVWQWSQWQDTYFFASRNRSLTTLQYEMVKIIRHSMSDISEQQIRSMSTESNAVRTTPQSIQNAIIMVVTLPILAVYPFIQKYFVKGMTLGAVKE